MKQINGCLLLVILNLVAIIGVIYNLMFERETDISFHSLTLILFYFIRFLCVANCLRNYSAVFVKSPKRSLKFYVIVQECLRINENKSGNCLDNFGRDGIFRCKRTLSFQG